MCSNQPRRLVTLGLLLTGLCMPAAQTRAEGDIEERTAELLVGEQQVISAEDVEKYSEGTAGIVEVRLPKDGKRFVLVALKPGKTTLLLLMRNGLEVRYNISVRDGGVKQRANVRLDFYFVQLSKNGGHRVGISWPGTIGGTASFAATRDFAANSTAATASIASQVLPRIDLGQTAGWAKIRRQATIIVANGEQGRFTSGGEMNFRIEGNLSSGIQKIPFGSEIIVVARYDAHSGRIELRITADVSELTEVGPDGLPGRTNSRVETLVNLSLGESLVLAGLQSESQSSSREGLPLLSNIPVLGYLFSSTGVRSERTENVLFIVPTVVEAMPLSSRDRVLESYGAYQRFSGDFTGKRLLEKTDLDEETDR